MDVVDAMQKVKMVGQSEPEVPIKVVSIRKIGEIPVPTKTGAKPAKDKAKKDKVKEGETKK